MRISKFIATSSIMKNPALIKEMINENDEVEEVDAEEKKEECVIVEINSDTNDDYDNVEVVDIEIVNEEIVDVKDVVINIQQDKDNAKTPVLDDTVDNDIVDVRISDETTGCKTFKCKQCNFEAARKEIMKQHKLDIHNWCSVCFSTFTTKEKLTLHIGKMHTKK